MIEITIKTLDSQNHSFSVEDDTTVKQFKEKISEKLPFPVDSQRLIYCGRVLQDDKNLSEYDVNGKVIHLVQRPPPSASTPAGPTNRAPGSGPRTSSSRERRFGVQGFRSRLDGGNAMYLGAMAIPTDIMDPNAVPQASQSLSQSRLSVARRMIRAAAATLTLLENGGSTAAPGEPSTPPEEAGTSSESNEENGSTPPQSATTVVQDVGIIVMANDESSRGPESPFIQPTTAAVIASAFSAARSSGVASHMTISRSSPGAEAVSLSVDMDAQGNITHVNGDDFQQASSSASETPAETSPDENETPPTEPRAATSSGSRRLLRQGFVRPATMATLMEELARVNSRLQPFQERYVTLLREDASHVGDETSATASNVLFTRVSDVMHCLAHAHHALSDIMCDFAQAPPRVLRCRPVLIQHSAVLQAGIPISAQISMLANRVGSSAPQSQPSGERPAAAPTADEATQAPANPESAPPTSEEQGANPGMPRVRILRGGTPQYVRGPPTMGNLTPGNVEFIMEVGPGSITIDSVEATLMSGNTAVTLGSLGSIDASMLGEGGSFPWGSPAPPEFIQNLMQAVAGHMINRSTADAATTTASDASATSAANATPNVPGQNSQARGNTATHPTTSTQTRSTSRPHVHLAQAVPSFGSNAFDPFLPCNSHHVVRPSSRRRTRAAADAERDAPLATSSPITARPAATDQPQPSAPAAPHMLPVALAPLAEMMQRLGGHGIGSVSFADIASSSATLPIVEDIVRSMSEAVASASGDRGTTLADMLHSMPDHSYVEGQYLITDLIMTAARNLTFQDMRALSMGRSETLNALQPQLREFLTQRSMQNEAPTAESVRRGAERLNAELRQYLDILREGRMRSDIDVVQTIDQFNESRLAQMMEMIVLENSEESFGCRLVAWFRSYLREMLSILLHCCVDGMSGLERILTRYVHLLTSGVPSAIQEWTASSSLGHLRTYMGANIMPADQIERFLRRPAEVSPGTAEFSDIPVDDGPGVGAVLVDEPEPMETDVVTVETSPAEVVVAAADIPAALVDLVPIPAATLPVIIPEAWHSSIPSDWVPIISRDSQRQRRQSPQAPFSDAYLSGMPSKRRKVVASSKPQGSLGQVISEGVRQAVEVTGAAAVIGGGVESVAEASGAAVEVQTAYRAQVRSAVRDSLVNNPDFVPERFPNAAKYFTKK